MKKRFLGALATGLFLFGAAGIVQATPIQIDPIQLTGDYNSIMSMDKVDLIYPGFNSDPIVSIDDVYTKVLDSEGDLIGYASTTFSGYYIGTIDHNEEKSPSLAAYLKAFLGEPADYQYEVKVEDGDVSNIDNGVILTVNYASEYKSGEWTVSSPATVSFYTIFGGSGYALYFVSPELATGKWTTENIVSGQSGNLYPQISHIIVTGNEAPIPEPGTILLFGTGLAGLAAVGRRRKN